MTVRDLLEKCTTPECTVTIKDANELTVAIFVEAYHTALSDTVLGYSVTGFSFDRSNRMVILVSTTPEPEPEPDPDPNSGSETEEP
jgi:hypothetical protein